MSESSPTWFRVVALLLWLAVSPAGSTTKPTIPSAGAAKVGNVFHLCQSHNPHKCGKTERIENHPLKKSLQCTVSLSVFIQCLWLSFSHVSGVAPWLVVLGPDLNISTIGLISMKFWTDINGPERTNPSDFTELSTFPLVPPSGQNVLTTVSWITMKFGSDIHISLRMNCNNLNISISTFDDHFDGGLNKRVVYNLLLSVSLKIMGQCLFASWEQFHWRVMSPSQFESF